MNHEVSVVESESLISAQSAAMDGLVRSADCQKLW